MYEKAGIYAEFGKVVCISMGFILQKDGETQIRLKSIANKDEQVLLQEFIDLCSIVITTLQTLCFVLIMERNLIFLFM